MIIICIICHSHDLSDNVFCHKVIEELSARLRLGWRGEIDTTTWFLYLPFGICFVAWWLYLIYQLFQRQIHKIICVSVSGVEMDMTTWFSYLSLGICLFSCINIHIQKTQPENKNICDRQGILIWPPEQVNQLIPDLQKVFSFQHFIDQWDTHQDRVKR